MVQLTVPKASSVDSRVSVVMFLARFCSCSYRDLIWYAYSRVPVAVQLISIKGMLEV